MACSANFKRLNEDVIGEKVKMLTSQTNIHIYLKITMIYTGCE